MQIAEYLATLTHTNMRTLSDLIAFNIAHCPKELVYYGQEIFELAQSTSGDLTDPWRYCCWSPMASPPSITSASFCTSASMRRRSDGLARLHRGVLRRQGRLADALAVLESGEAFVTRSGERIFQSEFIRVRGLIAHDDGDRMVALSAFQRALDAARSQGARLFELGAATALVECGGAEARRFREDLERTYASFSEALDRPDLQRARAALDRRG